MGKKGGGGRTRLKQMGPKGSAANPMKDLMENNEPTITPPPKMDSTITRFVPDSESFILTTAHKSYPCIWPSYMDATKSAKEGRRIGQECCVEHPSVLDISEVLDRFGVRHAVQPYKGYPRDVESRWDNPGRVLYDFAQMRDKLDEENIVHVNLSNDDSSKLEDSSFTQKQCWKFIASKIDDMPGRKLRVLQAEQHEEAEKKKSREDARMRAILNSKKTAAPSVGSSKKKGKKKK
jgi:signal recognition particle subunit SEC65